MIELDKLGCREGLVFDEPDVYSNNENNDINVEHY